MKPREWVQEREAAEAEREAQRQKWLALVPKDLPRQQGLVLIGVGVAQQLQGLGTDKGNDHVTRQQVWHTAKWLGSDLGHLETAMMLKRLVAAGYAYQRDGQYALV